MAEVLAKAEVACVLRSGDRTGIDLGSDLRLRELTKQHEVAFLIENDTERAKQVAADGVHIAADVALYRRARDHLGQRAIIGVGCGESRHDAMMLAELGADYVAFGPIDEGGEPETRAELIAWWSEIFEVPCVAWNVETRAEAERLAGLGADFVALSAAVWQTECAAKLIAEIGTALRGVGTVA